MKLTARLVGSDGLRRPLARIAGERGLRAELAAAAGELRDAARAELDDAGPDAALSRSLTIALADDRPAATVGAPLDQGWRREFGALRRPPRPWLAPALDAARPRILARLRAWLAGAAWGRPPLSPGEEDPRL